MKYSEERKAQKRAYYHANREKHLKYSKEYSVANKESVRERQKKYAAKKKIYSAAYNQDPSTWARRKYGAIKWSAKSRGLEFNLSPEDFHIPDVCPFTLLPFDIGPKNGSSYPQSPSVDRIDPFKGYIRGNVRIISKQANTAKSNIVDPAVFERIAADLRLRGFV